MAQTIKKPAPLTGPAPRTTTDQSEDQTEAYNEGATETRVHFDWVGTTARREAELHACHRYFREVAGW